MDSDQKLMRLERILKKRVLKRGEYTSVATECLSLIEQALRHVFRRHVPRLDNTDRLTVRQAEADIGQGTVGIERFTLGQLVALLRSAHLLDAWERVSRKNLEKIRLINLDELTTLYTTIIHGDREVTRAEAEFLVNCLHVLLETFEITSNELDEPSPEQVSNNREAAAILLKGKGPSDDQDQPLLFVSYAHVDDQPAPGVDDGRVTRLLQRLKTLLHQKLDREDGYSLWIDSSLNENDQVASQFLHAIHQTTILIVILSRNYIASDWCQREQTGFLDMVHDRAHRESSVFVIERDRLSYEEWPPEFEEITGHRYPFWDDLRYHTLLNDLSYDLADELRKRTKRPEILVSHDRPVVLLADVTDDLYPVREEVESYLRQANLRVLPEDAYYPYESRAFQQAVHGDLFKSQFFVQLLSGVSGKRPKDLRQSRARCQYELALEAGKPVLQWRSPELDIDTVQDPDQQALLRLDTVLAAGIEEFTSEIVKRVTPQKPSAPSFVPDIQTIGILLFLNANISEDSPLITQICQVFNRFGVGYILPLQSEKPSENREAFEQYVLHCDALVIVYGEVSVKWVSDQLLAIRKISWKRQQPLTAFAIFDGPPPQKPPVNIKLPNMRILHCRDCVDGEKLLDFIESLQNERTGSK